MKKLASLILGILLLTGQPSARAASTGSDWPSLGFDAAQSNNNSAEMRITPQNALKLKVKWTSPIADASYPIVAAGRVYLPVIKQGRVHVRVVDAASGKQTGLYAKDAEGGILALRNQVYLAGHVLQDINPATGDKAGAITASPHTARGTFLNPLGTDSVMVAGYYPAGKVIPTSLYAIDPQSNKVLWKVPSISALGTIGPGRILTQTSTGSELYDTAGKRVTSQPNVYSDWFAGSILSYTVASIGRRRATLYAVDGTGARIWKRAVGPYSRTTGWPHAVSQDSLYIQTLLPAEGIEALDPESGHVQWSKRIQDIQRIVLANDLLFVLTFRLGQPVHLVIMRAHTGAPIGSIVLSADYSVYPTQNELMVAAGMVFIRAVGPGGPQLIALGL